MLKVHLIRTLYPHWGKYSGIHQYTKYLDSQNYQIDIWVAPDNDEDFPIKNRGVRACLRSWVQRRGMKWYKLSDLVAELTVFWKSRDVNIIHYLDGEHSAQFIPKLRRFFPQRTPKLISTYHQPPDILDSLIDKSVIPYLDRVIVVSPDQVSYFAPLIDPEKICVVLHGIDTNYFRPGELSSSTGVVKCLTVGHYLRDFNALKQVAEKLTDDPSIEFHIVSSNASELELLPNIVVHKHINDEVLLKLYQQSDILFLPLIQSTANNALLEGIACGLPIISTDLVSVRAYLPGQEAILVKDNQPDDLLKAVLHLVHHPAERKRRGVAARQRAETLDWQNISAQFGKIYDDLAGCQPPSVLNLEGENRVEKNSKQDPSKILPARLAD